MGWMTSKRVQTNNMLEKLNKGHAQYSSFVPDLENDK